MVSAVDGVDVKCRAASLQIRDRPLRGELLDDERVVVQQGPRDVLHARAGLLKALAHELVVHQAESIDLLLKVALPCALGRIGSVSPAFHRMVE